LGVAVEDIHRRNWFICIVSKAIDGVVFYDIEIPTGEIYFHIGYTKYTTCTTDIKTFLVKDNQIWHCRIITSPDYKSITSLGDPYAGPLRARLLVLARKAGRFLNACQEV